VAHEPASPLWYGLYGFLPAAATAAIAWIKLYIERRDKKDEAASGLRDKLFATMSEREREAYERLERENTRLTNQVRDLERDKAEIARDRDRGWYLARWWEGYAHDIKHRLSNLLFRANGRLELAKLKPVPVPDIHWPTLEEPMPKPRESKPDV
jgi:hypothetical protein